MTRILHRLHDEFPALRAALETQPAHTTSPFRAAYPGVSRDILTQLRAETATPAPAALRHAFDARRWIPVSVGLRAVPLASVPIDDIDDVITDILAAVAAAPFVRHETALLMALAPITAQLNGGESL